jgi:monofunctional biosynthetic peptidoglycan transglycosylase
MSPNSRLRRLRTTLLWGILGWLLVTTLLVGAMRWIDPPTSSFMLQDQLGGWWEGRERPWVHHDWIPWESIPAVVSLAVVAAEDQRFRNHSGFDLIELEKAWTRFRAGGRLRGASTLSQQVAKNLFLWSGKSLVRKGIEAWFTLLIELTWSKRRILEVYLNIAQLGPHTYGVGAASWRFFHRPVSALTAREAALMAAVLPNPERYRLESPSARVKERAAWIRRQMGQLGPGHLDGI